MEKLFMAFAKGNESVDSAEIKRYIGVGSIKVLAVNANKSELEKIYKTFLDKEPEYIREVEINGSKVKSAQVDFVVQTDPDKCDGIETTTRVAFFINKEYRFNRDKSKVQVIDKYGRTAWVTQDELKNHDIPMYKNGPANLDKDYRPCYIGEEALTNFIRVYLNIPNPMKYINGSWIMNENPEDSESRLDNIEKYFNGDFSEVKEAIALQPNNKVKALFGIRNANDGRQYQAIYNGMFLRNGASDFSKLAKEIDDRKAAGALSNTEFEICPIHEYSVAATSFEKTEDNSTDDLPW